MNRSRFIKEYLSFIKAIDVNAEQAVVGAGGSLLLFGLRTATQDIDVAVLDDLFDTLKKKYKTKTIEVNDEKVEIVIFNSVVDIHRLDPTIKTMMMDGVCTYTPEEVLKQKKKLNRPKDQPDIKNLEAYLEKQKKDKNSIYHHWSKSND